MKLKHISKLLALGVISLVITGCGGGSSSSEIPPVSTDREMLIINEQNADQVYLSFSKSLPEVMNFIEYTAYSLKEINSPCAPIKNDSRILNNCEESYKGLILNGQVTTVYAENDLNLTYVDFSLTSMHDDTTMFLEEASFHWSLDEDNSDNSFITGTIEGYIVKDGNRIVLDDYAFTIDKRGLTFNGFTKLESLNKWVEEKTLESNDGVLLTGNNSELKVIFNPVDRTVDLYLNGEFYADHPSPI